MSDFDEAKRQVREFEELKRKATSLNMAKEQGKINQDAAWDQFLVSNPNQITPFGEINWFGNLGGRQTVETKLSPDQQRIFDQSNRLMHEGLMATQLGQEFDMSGAPGRPDLFNNLDRDKIAQMLIDRNQPQMDRDRERLRTQLSNQGIMQGSEAYTSAFDDLGRQENDFRLGAYASAGDEQSRIYGMQQDARNQYMNEALTTRQLPLNELNALKTGAQIQPPQARSFGGYQYQPFDAYGAYQDQQANSLARSNASDAKRNNMQSGLVTLGAAALMSDRRMKENIYPVGFSASGLTIYEFTYKGSDQVHYGFMSDEVRHVFPDSVFVDENGIDFVDYAQTDFPRIH